jgi:hypothetical protein
MPTHAEQTRAILEAGQFLDWLCGNCKTLYPMVAPSVSLPMKLRQEAFRIVSRLPQPSELTGWCADDTAVAQWVNRTQEATGDRPAGRTEDRQPLFSSRPPWPE